MMHCDCSGAAFKPACVRPNNSLLANSIQRRAQHQRVPVLQPSIVRKERRVPLRVGCCRELTRVSLRDGQKGNVMKMSERRMTRNRFVFLVCVAFVLIAALVPLLLQLLPLILVVGLWLFLATVPTGREVQAPRPLLSESSERPPVLPDVPAPVPAATTIIIRHNAPTQTRDASASRDFTSP